MSSDVGHGVDGIHNAVEGNVYGVAVALLLALLVDLVNCLCENVGCACICVGGLCCSDALRDPVESRALFYSLLSCLCPQILCIVCSVISVIGLASSVKCILSGLELAIAALPLVVECSGIQASSLYSSQNLTLDLSVDGLDVGENSLSDLALLHAIECDLCGYRDVLLLVKVLCIGSDNDLTLYNSSGLQVCNCSLVLITEACNHAVCSVLAIVVINVDRDNNSISQNLSLYYGALSADSLLQELGIPCGAANAVSERCRIQSYFLVVHSCQSSSQIAVPVVLLYDRVLILHLRCLILTGDRLVHCRITHNIHKGALVNDITISSGLLTSSKGSKHGGLCQSNRNCYCSSHHSFQK